SAITGSEAGITVNPAAARVLTVSGYPSPVTAGTAHTLVVQALDAFGNLATGYLGTVSFSSSDPQALLPASYTFTVGDGVRPTVTGTLRPRGSQPITARHAAHNLSGSQTGIVVQ